jgi:hypothetical protein
LQQKRYVGKRLKRLIGAVDRGSREINAARQRVGVRLNWLVNFAFRDLSRMGSHRRRAVTMEAYAFALTGAGSMRRSTSATLSTAELVELALKARDALEALTSGRYWDLPIREGLRRRVMPLSAQGIRRRNPLSMYEGPLPEMVLWAAADLVCAEGWRLARCSYGRCERRLFVRARPNQDFCSKRCSLLERTRRHRAEQPSHKASEYRHKLYVRQVAREKGISEKNAARMVRRRADKEIIQ